MGSSRPSFKYNSVSNQWELRGKSGQLLQKFNDTGRGNQVVIMTNTFNTKGWGSDAKWIPRREGCYCEEYYSDIRCWMPFNFLQIGDQIVSYKIVGELMGTGATFSATLYRVNKSDPITETAVAGGGTGDITAQGELDTEVTLTSPETVATDKMYLLELIGTNAGWTDWIYVMGAEVVVNRAL